MITHSDLVTLSPGALTELKKNFDDAVAQRPLSEKRLGVRIGVKGGGCAGMSYLLDFDYQTEHDLVLETSGFPVFVDKAQGIYLSGTVLDYEGGLKARGFLFKNPNAASTCGCGSSFGV